MRRSIQFENRSLDRRRFTQVALAGSVLTFPRLAAAQTPSASPAASPATGDTIVSSIESVPTAYTRYPDPFASTDNAPGNGGEVVAFTLSYMPPPPNFDDNPYWQGLDERLGVKWRPTMVAAEAYDERLATTFASGDIPDLMYLLHPHQRAIALEAIEQGAFVDLTPIVESDRINDYPNLATLPKYQWDATRHQGKIWGVPKPILRNNGPTWHRTDWYKPLGTTALGSIDDVFAYLTGASSKDPDGDGDASNTWGLVPPWGDWNGGMFDAMFRVPFRWRLNDDGTLTSAIETTEMRDRLAYQVELYKAGAFHPDGAGLQASDAKDIFSTGRAAMLGTVFHEVLGKKGWKNTVKEYVPDAVIEPVILPSADGGEAATYEELGIFGYTAISSAADDSRVDELLRIMNYMLAPFGSEESTYLRYGIEGQQSERTDDGGYELTDEGIKQTGGLVYPFISENFFYFPGEPEDAILAQKHNELMAANAVADPTMGLSSATGRDSGAVLNQLVVDTANEIVVGRSSLDAWDKLVTEWRERGGDAMRSEFEQALKEAK